MKHVYALWYAASQHTHTRGWDLWASLSCVTHPTTTSSKVSHRFLVNMIRHRIIFNHPDLTLIPVLSMVAGRVLMESKRRQCILLWGLNLWRQYTGTITPTVTFCFIYQTDSWARLAIRRVGLCTLRRWTHRVDRSVMLTYRGARFLS